LRISNRNCCKVPSHFTERKHVIILNQLRNPEISETLPPNRLLFSLQLEIRVFSYLHNSTTSLILNSLPNFAGHFLLNFASNTVRHSPQQLFMFEHSTKRFCCWAV